MVAKVRIDLRIIVDHAAWYRRWRAPGASPYQGRGGDKVRESARYGRDVAVRRSHARPRLVDPPGETG
jgi:hypothetical protein